MKSAIFFGVVLFIFCINGPVAAQPWLYSGNNIYFNTGNVAIGALPNNNFKFFLNYPTSAGENTKTAFYLNRVTNMTSNSTSYDKAAYAGITSFNIPAGVRDGGYKIGFDASVYAGNLTGFAGTLKDSRALWARGGIHSAASTAVVENAYGVYAEMLHQMGTINNSYGVYIRYASPGGTIGQQYDLFAATASSKNYFAGNVGIGTTGPTEKLDVNGVIKGRNVIRWGNGVGVLGYQLNNKILIRGNSGYGLSLGANNQNDHLYIAPDGKVGIGTLSFPSIGNYKLAVAGDLICEKVKVQEQANWSDYVFAKDYPLMPLNELADYISTHHHLPNIPSAEEVAKNGFFLGDMDAKLLEKIEELTLHMIEKEEEVTALRETLDELSLYKEEKAAEMAALKATVEGLKILVQQLTENKKK